MRYIGRDNVKKLLADVSGDVRLSAYQEGAVRFETSGEEIVVRPQLPLEHTAVYEGFVPEPLYQALDQEPLIGALLVRLGGYAVGVYRGQELIHSKVGTRFVKNRNKKGGSSSNRFRRRRVEQAKALVEEAAAVAEGVLAPYRKELAALALGGDKEAVRLTLAESRLLGELAEHRLERFFTTDDPRQRVLEALPYDLYAAQVERRVIV